MRSRFCIQWIEAAMWPVSPHTDPRMDADLKSRTSEPLKHNASSSQPNRKLRISSGNYRFEPSRNFRLSLVSECDAREDKRGCRTKVS